MDHLYIEWSHRFGVNYSLNIEDECAVGDGQFYSAAPVGHRFKHIHYRDMLQERPCSHDRGSLECECECVCVERGMTDLSCVHATGAHCAVDLGQV